MDIHRIRYFNIFAELGSLLKASEVLGISQPALSKALKVLEREVGARLVEVDGRGLKLTEAGKRLRKESSPLLQEWLGLSKKIQGHAIQKQTRIASFEVFSTYFLGHLADFLALEGIDVLELSPGKMEQAVASGEAHLGITYVPIPKPSIRFVEAGKIRMSVFGLEKFKNKKFEDLPFVVPLMPTEGTPSKVIGLDGWPEHKHERKVKYRVGMMESALELCRRGHAVAYLPDFVVSIHNKSHKTEFHLKELSTRLPQKERQQSVYLISPENQKETELERKVAKCIRLLS